MRVRTTAGLAALNSPTRTDGRSAGQLRPEASGKDRRGVSCEQAAQRSRSRVGSIAGVLGAAACAVDS